jgi:hypothetical protein
MIYYISSEIIVLGLTDIFGCIRNHIAPVEPTHRVLFPFRLLHLSSLFQIFNHSGSLRRVTYFVPWCVNLEHFISMVKNTCFIVKCLGCRIFLPQIFIINCWHLESSTPRLLRFFDVIKCIEVGNLLILWFSECALFRAWFDSLRHSSSPVTSANKFSFATSLQQNLFSNLC